MSRELDVRDFRDSVAPPAGAEAVAALADEVSARLPGEERIRIEQVDRTTGNPSLIASEGSPPEEGDYVRRALAHVQSIGPALGFAARPAEFVADPAVQEASSGAKAVYLQQRYKGIPVFQAAQTVRFAPDGALHSTAGSSISVEADLEARPPLSASEAVAAAAAHVAEPDPDEQGARDHFGEPLEPPRVDLAGFEPSVLAGFPGIPERPTTLAPGPFGAPITASLVWFPLGAELGLALAWDVLITMPGYAGQYQTLVDAQSGRILYCRQRVQTVAARGHVYRVDGRTPREMTDFPRPLADYELPLPPPPPALAPEFPDDWVGEASTAANCTHAHLGDAGPALEGRLEDGVVLFDPQDPTGDEQKVLNIFYYCCYMHDFFYLLGFREADGNFQRDDFGRGGRTADAVDARSYPGAVYGTANMSTPVDGQSPTMRMGMVTHTNRHTALDSSVVYHEFTHGVTNRLVGGPMNVNALDSPQSGGMGEGWGDYIACTVNGTSVLGDWVLDDPRGIREFPVDERFPDTFADLGAGRYDEVHNIGEVWCATLVALNRRIGTALALQLVVDALKLAQANPSFLNMRDAILLALEEAARAGRVSEAERADAATGAWEVFARFGMGPNAQSNGAQLTGIVADFTTP